VTAHGRIVTVRAHAHGRIRLTVDGRMERTQRLVHGAARFHLPRLARGTHRLRVAYLGRPRTAVVRAIRVR